MKRDYGHSHFAETHRICALSQADPCASSILVDELDARPLQHRFNHGQRRFVPAYFPVSILVIVFRCSRVASAKSHYFCSRPWFARSNSCIFVKFN